MAKPLNRKALYDLVWSKPMTAAAKEYGLSDRGLAKLCERNSIPVPSRGYWAKKAAGQKVKKAPLIVLDKQEPETAILLRKATPVFTAKQENQTLPEAIQNAIEREKLPQNRIKIPATMHNPHPIVAQWIKAKDQEIQEAKRYGWDWRSPITALDRRKWRITSCLFKELEARGFKIVEEGQRGHQKEPWIQHGQDKASFHIAERIKQCRCELTEEEKKDRLYSDQRWRQERENTGKLEITLDGEHSHPKVKIQEDDEIPFEETLNEIVIKLIETIWASKCRRLEREENERKRREEEHAHYERKRAAEKEEQRKSRVQTHKLIQQATMAARKMAERNVWA